MTTISVAGLSPRKVELVTEALAKSTELIELHQQGYGAGSIAQRLGLSVYGVRRCLQAVSLRPRREDLKHLGEGRKCLRLEDFPEARATDLEYRRLYESGLGVREIAAAKGVTFQRVTQRLRRSGCAMRPRSREADVAAVECGTCKQVFQVRVKAHRKFCSRQCFLDRH